MTNATSLPTTQTDGVRVARIATAMTLTVTCVQWPIGSENSFKAKEFGEAFQTTYSAIAEATTEHV